VVSEPEKDRVSKKMLSEHRAAVKQRIEAGILAGKDLKALLGELSREFYGRQTISGLVHVIHVFGGAQNASP